MGRMPLKKGAPARVNPQLRSRMKRNEMKARRITRTNPRIAGK